MDISGISYSVMGYYTKSLSTDKANDSIFADAIKEHKGTGVRANTHSTVDDYVTKHPDSKGQIDRLLNPGLNIMKQYGKSDAEVEEMSMDEYKKYIYGILDKIPYDPSQLRDTQFIDITEKGWEQMKNDPKYEAWVVGYFKVDRSVHVPFANYPGVQPNIHTEHFGATIDEHLGQSYPQSMKTGNEKDSEGWWKKRQKRHEEFRRQVKEYEEKRRISKEEMRKAMECLWARGEENTNMGYESNTMSSVFDLF